MNNTWGRTDNAYMFFHWQFSCKIFLVIVAFIRSTDCSHVNSLAVSDMRISDICYMESTRQTIYTDDTEDTDNTEDTEDNNNTEDTEDTNNTKDTEESNNTDGEISINCR